MVDLALNVLLAAGVLLMAFALRRQSKRHTIEVDAARREGYAEGRHHEHARRVRIREDRMAAKRLKREG